MPLLLRTVKHNRWLGDLAAPFLANGDVPSDPFADLLTKDNLLSVWEVAENRANVERIVRAVAVGRQELAPSGYVIFDSELLAGVGIEIRNDRGTSPDEGANGWHRDLVLSGRRLLALARIMLGSGKLGVVSKPRLQQLVEEGIRARELPERLPVKFCPGPTR